jgi:DNA-binding NarL/FixJ family response regulator
MTEQPITLLLADDHAIVRAGIRELLQKRPRFSVIAEADNGVATLQMVKDHRPDVVIMDISMPDMNGIEATRHIAAEVPATKVIALSMHTDERFVANMLGAGASGYLLKNSASEEELTRAIDAVMRGQIYVTPSLISTVAEELAKYTRGERPHNDLLTPKEKQVLQLLAEGRSTRLIAEILMVSTKTVEKHREHIMDKLDFHSIAELTKFAIREGYTSLGGSYQTVPPPASNEA